MKDGAYSVLLFFLERLRSGRYLIALDVLSKYKFITIVIQY